MTDSEISVEQQHKTTDSVDNQLIEAGNVISEAKETKTFADYFTRFKKSDDIKEKDRIRYEINDTFLLNTAQELTEDDISTALNRADFFIARVVWDKEKGKFHDHFVIVKERLVILENGTCGEYLNVKTNCGPHFPFSTAMRFRKSPRRRDPSAFAPPIARSSPPAPSLASRPRSSAPYGAASRSPPALSPSARRCGSGRRPAPSRGCGWSPMTPRPRR